MPNVTKVTNMFRIYWGNYFLPPLYCFAAQGGLNISFHSTPAEVDLLSLYPVDIAYGILLLVLHPGGRKLSYWPVEAVVWLTVGDRESPDTKPDLRQG